MDKIKSQIVKSFNNKILNFVPIKTRYEIVLGIPIYI